MAESKGNILIVDDEESIRYILQRVLASEGYECTVASNGKEALKKAGKQDFDVVLLDIKMPKLSGMEVLPRIVAKHPDTCVVMTTAVVDMPTALTALNLGAYDYLTKPFNLDELSTRIEEVLERRKLVRKKEPAESPL